MNKLKKLNNEISKLLCENNSDINNSDVNNSDINNLKKKNINNVFLIENTNLEQFIDENLLGISSGFYKNNKVNEKKLNDQLEKDLIRKWDNIVIGSFKVKNNNKTILQNNSNRTEVSKYIVELVNTKLNNFLSSFTKNEKLLKKYIINIKLFMQQGSQAHIFHNILQILKISNDSLIFLKPDFNNVKTKIYKKNNSILTKNIYEYYISTSQLQHNINIGSVKFIYDCNHTENKLTRTITFNWKKKYIRNIMNMIIKSNIAENIMNKLYEKIFCKEKIANQSRIESCTLFYDKIEDIDKQFEYYYNLLKNKNLSKITEKNFNPSKSIFQFFIDFISLSLT